MEEKSTDMPNVKLGRICDGLFYGTGNVGYKVLGSLVSMPEKEFEKYESDLENLCKNDENEREI